MVLYGKYGPAPAWSCIILNGWVYSTVVKHAPVSIPTSKSRNHLVWDYWRYLLEAPYTSGNACIRLGKISQFNLPEPGLKWDRSVSWDLSEDPFTSLDMLFIKFLTNILTI